MSLLRKPSDQRDALLCQARATIARARDEGGPLREALVRGHGCCLINDPEFDQSLWDDALAEQERLHALVPLKETGQ